MRNRRSRSAKDYEIDYSRFKDEDHPVLEPSRFSHLPVAEPMTKEDFLLAEAYRQRRLRCLVEVGEKLELIPEKLRKQIKALGGWQVYRMVFLSQEEQVRVLALPEKERDEFLHEVNMTWKE